MKNESGRSLIEIFAVLSLMGILSVIAIAGFHRLTNKNKANIILSDAQIGFMEESSLNPGHSEWTKVSFDPVSQKEIFTLHDKIGQVFVKINAIEKEICTLLLVMKTDGKLNFYTQTGEEIKNCSEENEMLFAFNGAGKPAECGQNIDCGEEFLGYCDKAGQCIQCDDKSQTINEEGNGCICDSDFALSCNDGENSWCCGYDEEYHPLICGRQKDKCINPEGICWMNIQKRGPSQKNCAYNIGSNVTYCAHEVAEENDQIVLKDVAGQSCQGVGQYCLLNYTDENHTLAIDSTFTTGFLYGTCISVEDFNEVSVSTISPKDSECASGEYCLLNYTDENHTQEITDDFEKGTLYGTCISTEDFNEINPSSFNIGNLDEEQGCPAGYYCNVQWTDKMCQNVEEDFSTGTLYGVCLKLNDFTPACPY